jgi:hypothetical protein
MDWVLKKILADENELVYFYKTELPYNIGKHTNTTNCSVCQAIDHQMVVRYRDCKGGNCTVKYKFVRCKLKSAVTAYQKNEHLVDCKTKDKCFGILPDVRDVIVAEFKKFHIQPKQLHAFITTKTDIPSVSIPALNQIQGLINRNKLKIDDSNHLAGVEEFISKRQYANAADENEAFFFGSHIINDRVMIGTGSDSDHLNVCLTSYKLISTIKNFENRLSIFNIDATYKLSKNRFPLVVFGN